MKKVYIIVKDEATLGEAYISCLYDLADRLSEIDRDINNLIARKTDLEKKRDDIASALKALDNVRMGR